MPKITKDKTAKAKASRKRRAIVKDLPMQRQELTGKALKKVRGALQEATQMESRKFQT